MCYFLYINNNIFLYILNYLTIHDIIIFDSSCLFSFYLKQKYLNIIQNYKFNNKIEIKNKQLNWIIQREISILNVNYNYNDSYNQNDVSIRSRIENIKKVLSIKNIQKLKIIDTSNSHQNKNDENNNNNQQGQGQEQQQQQQSIQVSNLFSLDLSSCSFLNDDNSLINLFENIELPQLTYLYLNNQSNITTKFIKMITKKYKNLITLDLSSCLKIDQLGVNNIITNNGLTLQNLYLENCSQINSNTLFAISKVCNNLKLLNLANCLHITDSSLHKILLKCTQLSYLNISSTNISIKAFSNLPKSAVNSFTLIANNCSKMNDITIGMISCIYRKLSSIEIIDSSIDHGGIISLSQCRDIKNIKISLKSYTNSIPYLLCKCHQVQTLSLVGIQSNNMSILNQNQNQNQNEINEINNHIIALSKRLQQYGENIIQLNFKNITLTIQDLRILSNSCLKLEDLLLHSCLLFNTIDEWNELIHLISTHLNLSKLSLYPCDSWPENTLINILNDNPRKWKVLQFYSSLSSPSNCNSNCNSTSISISNSISTNYNNKVPISESDIKMLLNCKNLEMFYIDGGNSYIEFMKSKIKLFSSINSCILDGNELIINKNSSFL